MLPSSNSCNQPKWYPALQAVCVFIILITWHIAWPGYIHNMYTNINAQCAKTFYPHTYKVTYISFSNCKNQLHCLKRARERFKQQPSRYSKGHPLSFHILRLVVKQREWTDLPGIPREPYAPTDHTLRTQQWQRMKGIAFKINGGSTSMPLSRNWAI